MMCAHTCAHHSPHTLQVALPLVLQRVSQSLSRTVTARARRESVLPRVTALKDAVGFNVAALRFLDHEIRSAGIRTFEDADAVASGAGAPTKKLKLVT